MCAWCDGSHRQQQKKKENNLYIYIYIDKSTKKTIKYILICNANYIY